MLKNYIKIAFRNITRHKIYSFINIVGLAVGMAACILIFLWVQDELSYDRFHENADNIYRVVENQYYSGQEPFPVAVTPAPLAEYLKNEYPEIVNAIRLHRASRVLTYEQKMFRERNIIATDPAILEMFTFPLLKGNPETALSEPQSIILTEAMAKKYFGSADPMGKILKGETTDFTVTGVMETVPANSHLEIDFLIQFQTDKADEWGSNSYYTYIQLQDGTPYEPVSEKIAGVIKANAEGSVTEIYLQPLTDIHLHSAGKFTADIPGHGDILYVKIFSVIAVFVLLIACINFMNLATAKSRKRAKEIGIRKAAGASRWEIIKQFLGESMLYAVIALILAMILVELLLPTFNNLAQKELFLNFSVNSKMGWGLLGIVILTGLVAGSYPALYLSGFDPTKVLKSSVNSGSKSALSRKILVVFQFSISIILIIGTLIIFKQLHYIRNKKLGLEKENVVYVRMDNAVRDKYDEIKQEFLKNPNVVAVSSTSQLPLYIANSTSGFSWDGKNPEETILIHFTMVDPDYAHVFNIEMAEGRFYSDEYSTDTSGIVINEEAQTIMGLESPIGEAINGWDQEFEIIGVVKNFHFKPVNTTIEPLIMLTSSMSRWYNYVLIRINPDDVTGTLASLENTFEKLVTGSPFEYKFLDDSYDKMYRKEQRVGKIFNYFSFLAIFISCLGLFGLASFMAEQKTKEIGIRKVLGATIGNIVLLFSKEFTKWVIVASLIACPVAYYVMSRWLQNFAYRTDITAWIFVLSALIALAIALITVSFQAIKAAMTNPADVLKYE